MSSPKYDLKKLHWLWLSGLITVLDQFTKQWIVKSAALFEIRPIFFNFNIVLKYNKGAAFGFLAGAGEWQRWLFCLIAILVSSCIVVWLSRLPRRDHWTAIALALILGGALGNLWDRFRFGYVIDFIDFYIRGWHFATFNVADAAISVGAVMLGITLLRIKKQS